MAKRKVNYRNNLQFIDSAYLNNQTFMDYLNRFKKVALSVFEWVNLPESMDARWLERCLYYNGQATLLKDKRFGFINTQCCSNGNINIYGLPTNLNCYSFEYSTDRKLFTGVDETLSEAQQEARDYYECILVQNNWDREPTAGSMELFALRLYEAERSCDVNIKTQKYPYFILCDESQRLTIINMLKKIEGNEFHVVGDKNNLTPDQIKVLETNAPFVADKLQDYKKEIWNEALTFLGINNIMIDKKERLVTDEANSNNELINLNLQSYLAPRQEACKQFNKKFRLEGTDKEISVRVRSDLHNIIKNAQSIVSDYEDMQNLDNKITEEGEVNLQNG